MSLGSNFDPGWPSPARRWPIPSGANPARTRSHLLGVAGGWFALLALVSAVAALSTYSTGPVYEGDALVGLVFGDQRGADWRKFADERARVDAVAGVAVFVVLALLWGALRGRVKSSPVRAGTAAGVLAGAIFYALAGATRCTGNGHDFNVGSRAFVLLSAAYAVVSAALLAIRSSTTRTQ